MRLTRAPLPPPLPLLLLLAWAAGRARPECPPPRHIEPCACERGRMVGPRLSCLGAEPRALREVLDLLGLARAALYRLRIEGTRGMAIVGRGFFDGLDVRSLVVNDCNITHLEKDSLPPEIEELDLSGNLLRKVPNTALQTLNSLSTLSLDHNLIETLEAHAFSELKSLLRLSLYGNNIRLVDSRAFLGTERSLTRLNLGANRLGQVPRYALRRLGCLQSVSLRENQIPEVLVSEHLPPSLCELDLSGNEIVRLEPDSFSSLRQLSALDLEGNRIEHVNEDAFAGVRGSLEWLKLGGNSLRTIPHAAFRNLSRIRGLDLRCNRISRIDVHSFAGYGKSLRFIFLQKNNIVSIADGALDVLESAEWLYLQSNDMTTLRYDTFRGVIEHLQVLDLHDNPYHCDCDILWFRDWLHSKGQTVANLPKETRCNATREHAHKPIDKLTNSSFTCSGTTANHSAGLMLMILLLVVSFCR